MKREINCFILSSPRSGSTLLRLNLDKLDNVVALPETHFFAFLDERRKEKWSSKKELGQIAEEWVNYHTIKKMINNKQSLVASILDLATEMRDILTITIGAYLDERGIAYNDSTYIFEKSPPHIHYQEKISKYFPKASKLYLVRDPRDVIASLKTCHWSTSSTFLNACIWNKGIELINTDGIIVKYEELVEFPEKSFTEITNSLGLEFNPEALKKATNDSLESQNETSSSSMRPISKSKVGNYRTILSKPDRDVQVIEKICQKNMLKFGYKLTNLKFDKKARLKIYLGRLELLVLKFAR